MHPAATILAPIALIASVLAPGEERGDAAAADAADGALFEAPAPVARPMVEAGRIDRQVALPFPPTADQVRIEQRVTIRISPAPMPPRMPMMPSALSEQADAVSAPQVKEKKFGKCVPMGSIAGVQANADNRLMLLLRDQRVVSASLEKSCRGRDFYSGFRVAKNEDGMICQGRDVLMARTGANCKVSGFKQLVVQGN